LKINLEKFIFGNKEVSYLGFTLTPEGIKPGKNKLKAIQTAMAPADVKMIRSFVGLCNFFQTSSKRFSMTKKAFCGYARPITNIPERHYSYLGNIRKKLFAKPTTASSAVTTQT
jgi:hypothetical protein